MTEKRILFISKGEGASSTRYRALQFFPLFMQKGWSPHHVSASGGLFAWCKTLQMAQQADVVVVLRKTFPAPMLWMLRKVSKRLMFDLDDAIFCNTDGTASHTRMNRFAAIARVCDHIFAGNAFLAEQSSRFNPAVSIIPTGLDTKKYACPSVEKPGNHVDLVWIGSQSTRKYLLDILPALEHAFQRCPGLRLKIIADFNLPDAQLPTIPIAWSEALEAEHLASAHIGLAPMRSDDWSRGKCALKVLQYMSARLPVISSKAGMNAEIVKQGESGLLVSTDEEWSAAIKQLAADETLRLSMGLAGQSLVKDSYDISVVFEKMISVMEKTY